MKDKIFVIGLGFIGLPLAVAFASKNVKVIGYDVRMDIVEKTSRGIAHVYEPGLQEELKKVIGKNFTVTSNEKEIKNCKFIIITVGTPVDSSGKVVLTQIEESCRTIAKNMQKSSIVILKSTVPLLTTEEFVIPLLEKNSGLRCGKDFGVAFCPERTVEGQALKELFELPKVIGANDSKTLGEVAGLFSVLGGEIVKVSKPRVAEFVKLMDNTYRDVNIALANEFAKAGSALGIDAFEAIKAANRDYARNHILLPGAGVGGSCLTKDPVILASEAEKRGESLPLVRVARKVNLEMPRKVVELVKKVMKEGGVELNNSKIALLGLTFKSDTNDLRETPAKVIFDSLKRDGAEVTCYDKFAFPGEVKKMFSTKLESNLYKACEDSDCIVIATDHSEFRTLELKKLKKIMRNACIVDARHMIEPEEAIKLGFKFEGIGRPGGFFEGKDE